MAIQISDVTGVLPDPPEATASDEMVVSNRKIGIEVEVENCPYHGHRGKYPLLNVGSDGSLRNNGLEITTLPIKGSNIPEALTQLDKFFKELGLSPQCTERTGLHIHVDMRDCNNRQLLNLIVAYLIFEDVLFSFCGEYRKDNPYCVPMRDIVCSSGHMDGLLKTSRDSLLQAIDMHQKYSAMNLRPLLSLGTVEFRAQHGMCTKEEILPWANMVLCLVDFSMQYKESPQSMIDSVCKDPEALFSSVFRGSAGPLIDIYYGYMLEGARYAQEFYRHREPSQIKGSLYESLYNKSNKNKEAITTYDIDDGLENFSTQVLRNTSDQERSISALRNTFLTGNAPTAPQPRPRAPSRPSFVRATTRRPRGE